MQIQRQYNVRAHADMKIHDLVVIKYNMSLPP